MNALPIFRSATELSKSVRCKTSSSDTLLACTRQAPPPSSVARRDDSVHCADENGNTSNAYEAGKSLEAAKIIPCYQCSSPRAEVVNVIGQHVRL